MIIVEIYLFCGLLLASITLIVQYKNYNKSILVVGFIITTLIWPIYPIASVITNVKKKTHLNKSKYKEE